MFSFFSHKQTRQPLPLVTDIHSHLLPGLDDGVKTIEEAKKIVSQFMQLGYSKLIITPHIMNGHYHNSPLGIGKKLALLKNYIKNTGITIGAAAEYYLDESLLKKINSSESLMTFGAVYFLFETGFFSAPYFLNDFISAAIHRGYKPVLAHPERYQYLIADFEKVEELRSQKVLFQINIPSIVGFYAKPAQKMAYRLIDKGWVDFLGSDCHGKWHMRALEDAVKSTAFKKALELPLLNRNI